MRHEHANFSLEERAQLVGNKQMEMLCLHFSKTPIIDYTLMKKVHNFPVPNCGNSCQKSSHKKGWKLICHCYLLYALRQICPCKS
jgi:hypothetical protein